VSNVEGGIAFALFAIACGFLSPTLARYDVKILNVFRETPLGPRSVRVLTILRYLGAAAGFALGISMILGLFGKWEGVT